MSAMNSLRTISFAIAAAASVTMLLAAGDAEARGDGPSVIEEHFITKGPVKGYSGFAPTTGPRSFYCDYQRIPNRVCKVGPDGRERCKIENWTLKQFCY